MDFGWQEAAPCKRYIYLVVTSLVLLDAGGLRNCQALNASDRTSYLVGDFYGFDSPSLI